MERLRGVDAGFLYNETPTVHMHTLKVAILEPNPDVGEVPLDWFRAEVASRLPLLPVFRRRLVQVPFRFHHPVWVEDPGFDLAFHVRRCPVPAPGGRAEMDEVVADIASLPLDRSRPLWEMHLLDGLADGQIGVLVKIHHCVADGVAVAALLANVMSTSSEADREVLADGRVIEELPPDRWQPEPLPTDLRLVIDAFVDHLHQLARFPVLLWTSLRRLLAVARHRWRADAVAPRPVLDTPRTIFNASLTSARSFATGTVSLDDVRLVGRAAGVTVNDVVLAVVGGALRTYLADHGALPSRSLVAGVPTSTDLPGGGPRLSGNRVSNLFTTIGSDVADPVERLRVIHRTTLAAKAQQAVLGPEFLIDWVQYTPPAPWAWFMHRYAESGLAERHRPPINLVVSNVPGPRQPLYVGGARLEHLYSVGPVLEGIGLNITVWSYLDRLDIGVLAGREIVPCPHLIVEAMQASLAQLVDATAGTTADQVRPARRRA